MLQIHVFYCAMRKNQPATKLEFLLKYAASCADRMLHQRLYHFAKPPQHLFTDC
jgi:hypothetical protein